MFISMTGETCVFDTWYLRSKHKIEQGLLATKIVSVALTRLKLHFMESVTEEGMPGQSINAMYNPHFIFILFINILNF